MRSTFSRKMNGDPPQKKKMNGHTHSAEGGEGYVALSEGEKEERERDHKTNQKRKGRE